MPTKDEEPTGQKELSQTEPENSKLIQVIDASQSMSSDDKLTVTSTDNSADANSRNSMYTLSAFTSLTGSFSAESTQALIYALVNTDQPTTDVEQNIYDFTPSAALLNNTDATEMEVQRLELAKTIDNLRGARAWLTSAQGTVRGNFMSNFFTEDTLPRGWPETLRKDRPNHSSLPIKARTSALAMLT